MSEEQAKYKTKQSEKGGNFDWDRHLYLKSLTKELACKAFEDGDISPAEYLSLQAHQVDFTTRTRALGALRPKEGSTLADHYMAAIKKEGKITLPKHMQDEAKDNFKTRLYKEEEELRDKILKLNRFTLSDAFKAVSTTQSKLLIEQLSAMKIYHQCLYARIKDIEEQERKEKIKVERL